MKPMTTLGETTTPDGSKFTLHEHDGDFFLRLNGTQLMSSTWTLSERLLADYACPGKAPVAMRRILIGGLGLGFSLKRILELVGDDAEVVVAELLPEVVNWNREFLAELNGDLLDDSRVRIHEGDVYDCIRSATGDKEEKWDAILLDTDNGPTSLVQPQNHRIYGRGGFPMIFEALTPGARVAFWAAAVEPGFEKRLRRGGFVPESHSIKAHERAKKAIHWIYVGQRPVSSGDRAPEEAAPTPEAVERKSKPRRRWY